MLQLVRFRPCRETIAVLRVVLRLALAGDLRGLVLCYRTTHGEDVVLFTGVHRARPENALTAGDRIRVAAAKRLDLVS